MTLRLIACVLVVLITTCAVGVGCADRFVLPPVPHPPPDDGSPRIVIRFNSAAQRCFTGGGEMTIARTRLRSIWLALRTWPDRRAWLHCGGIALAYAAVAAPLGALFGFFRPDLPDWPVWKLILLPLVLLITPALGEELFFRALPLPHPAEGASRRQQLIASALVLVAFVLWHPLNGLWTPRAWPVFTDPVFLTLAALLGVACTLAYLASGSIWPSVLIHWVTVVV